MLQQHFYKQLAIIFIILVAAHFALTVAYPIFLPYQNLFWLSQVFFSGISIASFYGGKFFVRQKNKNTFLQFIMLLIFFRLMASAAIIIGYFKLSNPSSKVFLVPFFFVYLSYTIFEVYFLSKIGREQ
jgi:hypothetical protein